MCCGSALGVPFTVRRRGLPLVCGRPDDDVWLRDTMFVSRTPLLPSPSAPSIPASAPPADELVQTSSASSAVCDTPDGSRVQQPRHELIIECRERTAALDDPAVAAAVSRSAGADAGAVGTEAVPCAPDGDPVHGWREVHWSEELGCYIIPLPDDAASCPDVELRARRR